MAQNSDKPTAARSRSTISTMLRAVYQPIGFTKAYNFSMWFIFGGALVGFILARLQFLDIDGRFCPRVPASDGSTGMPAACYWVVHFVRYRVGMLLHLAASLPAGLIAVFQFVPGIRHHFILYHRIAGYVAITLAVVGNIGACMLADTAMGGALPLQALTGLVTLLTAASLGLAVYNIRRAQLDGHRAWMLRSWAIMGFIVTLRIIQFPMISIIARWPAAAKYVSVSCAELQYIYFGKQRLGEGTFTRDALDTYEAAYPDCAAASPANSSAVHVSIKGVSNPTDAGQTNAALMTTFVAAGFLALIIHAIVVEVYIWLTPSEAQRLRRISYEKQLARGYRIPGSAGIVAQRFGDAEAWIPPPSDHQQRQLQEEEEEAVSTSSATGK
ncbi:hypothetical protein ACO1O0_005188 [Amphichorda felina]